MYKEIENKKHLTWIFYINAFISYLYNGIIGPLFIIYLLAININPAQIGIILAAQRISIIIFEVPTGIFADRYGRKKSILISFFIFAILFLLWYLLQNFYILILISILGGFAYTFQSGAKEALMIDTLALKNNDHKRNKIFTNISMIGNVGFIFGGLLATVIAIYSIKSIWLAASLANLLLFFLFLFFIQENFKYNHFKERNKMLFFLKTAINDLKSALKNQKIFLLIIINAIFSFIIAVYGLLYPILFKETINLPNYSFGLLGSLSALVGILGIFLVKRIAEKKNYFQTFNILSAALLLFFLLFGFKTIFLWSIIVFVLIEMTINSWYPIYQSLFNKFILDKNRSSILSINSTLGLLFIACGEILAGLLLNFLKPNLLIMVISPLFLIIIILIAKLQKIKKCPEQN